jgi:ubiquinone/menaquinone biosynthesis C-methylase UbiE
MIFTADRPIVRRAEALAGTGDVAAVLACLRRLSALDFGMLHLDMPQPAFPNLSRMLPRMASEEVQRAYTGSAGYDMFRQTKDFVLRLQVHFERICRRPLDGATILDYGCGWGRLARMMMYYTNPDRFWGVDPAVEAIELCRTDGILGHLAVSDYLTQDLPVGDAQFDLMYSYSVFTHTSRRATLTALAALRRHIKPDGLLVLTVRPVEIWNLGTFGENENADTDALIAEFERTGFAFLPNIHYTTDGDHTYGVTSIAPRWITENAPGWKLVAQDRGEDHQQYILMLQPQ